MTFQEYVDGYNAAPDKMTYVKNSVTNPYMPFMQKLETADRLVKAFCYQGGRFRRRTAVIEEMCLVEALKYYCDVDIDYSKDSISEVCDFVSKNQIDILGRDFFEFRDVVMDELYDSQAQEENLAELLRNQMSALNQTIETLFEEISKEGPET